MRFASACGTASGCGGGWRIPARIVRYGRRYRRRKAREARALQICSVGRIGPSPLPLQIFHPPLVVCLLNRCIHLRNSSLGHRLGFSSAARDSEQQKENC